MSCAACAARVHDALSSLDGVVSVSVNLATERAAIEYIPSRVGMREFKKTTKDAGYEILTADKGEDIVEKEKREREAHYRNLKTKVITGALLSLPVFILTYWDMFGLPIALPRKLNFIYSLSLNHLFSSDWLAVL